MIGVPDAKWDERPSLAVVASEADADIEAHKVFPGGSGAALADSRTLVVRHRDPQDLGGPSSTRRPSRSRAPRQLKWGPRSRVVAGG